MVVDFICVAYSYMYIMNDFNFLSQLEALGASIKATVASIDIAIVGVIQCHSKAFLLCKYQP